MNREEFLLLLNKFLAGKTSATEEELLFEYYNFFQESEKWNTGLFGSKEDMESRMLERLQNSIQQKKHGLKNGNQNC